MTEPLDGTTSADLAEIKGMCQRADRLLEQIGSIGDTGDEVAPA